MKSVQTDRDQEVLQRLKNSVVEEPPKARRNLKWLWAIPSGAVAVAVATVLIVELVPAPGGDLGGIKYDENNVVQEFSDLTELSNSLTNLTLHLTEDQAVEVTKASDSVSGDDLYFVLAIEESSQDASYSMRFLIVVNENYDYDKFEIDEKFITQSYSDYSITYYQEITPDSDFGINTVECSAKIDSAKYEMYVLKYQEYSLENGTFLTVIDNMLEFHN